MFSRRDVVKGLGTLALGVAGAAGYAVAEPFRLVVTRYNVVPNGWPPGLRLRLALIADLHVCDPWMGVGHLKQIVARTNSLAPHAVLLLGDYRAGSRISKLSREVPDAVWAGELGQLKAPLGVHAVLGNHDWWDDKQAQRARRGPTTAGLALEAVGIPVYENRAVRLQQGGQPFWLAGLGDQWAFFSRRGSERRRRMFEGVHDVEGTLAQVTDDAPVILMAHEPDIFAELPARVALTVSGHTHGGQVNLLGYAPIVPSRYGRRYVYGHIVEGGRDLVVSGGLGCSGLPMRFGVPPEIVIVELGDWSGVGV